jgi:hypothetical protein
MLHRTIGAHHRSAMHTFSAWLFGWPEARDRYARSMRRQRGDDLLDRIGQVEHSQTERDGDQKGVDFAGGFVDPA